jgi:hypothetical protein
MNKLLLTISLLISFTPILFAQKATPELPPVKKQAAFNLTPGIYLNSEELINNQPSIKTNYIYKDDNIWYQKKSNSQVEQLHKKDFYAIVKDQQLFFCNNLFTPAMQIGTYTLFNKRKVKISFLKAKAASNIAPGLNYVEVSYLHHIKTGKIIKATPANLQAILSERDPDLVNDFKLEKGVVGRFQKYLTIYNDRHPLFKEKYPHKTP